MGIFGNKKEEKKDVKKVAKDSSGKKKTSKKTKGVAPVKITAEDLSWVLKGPRITEKAAISATDSRTYIFNVDPRATKPLVRQAIFSIYKVTPVKINISSIPYKSVTRKRVKGQKGGGKKAFVFLKEGETIEFV